MTARAGGAVQQGWGMGQASARYAAVVPIGFRIHVLKLHRNPLAVPLSPTAPVSVRARHHRE